MVAIPPSWTRRNAIQSYRSAPDSGAPAKVGHRASTLAAAMISPVDPGEDDGPRPGGGRSGRGPSSLVDTVTEPAGQAPSSASPWRTRGFDCSALIANPLINRH